MPFCEKCGAEVPPEKKFCDKCGNQMRGLQANIPQQATYQQQIPGQAPYQQSRYVTLTSDKSRTVVLVLCLLLGWLGIHRFYAGHVCTGIIYFFTFGIFGFGWLFDILMILLGNFKDNVGAPIRAW